MDTKQQGQASARAASWMTVDEAGDGQRLDNFLIRHLKGVPKSHIYRIIRSGEVRRNKGRVAADDKLQIGDVLRIPPIRVAERVTESEGFSTAPPREFSILYEDDAFLAIDKPAGIAVHGGSGVSFGVIEQLRRSRPTAPFLELVHRLDRETSGLLLVAKKRRALTALQALFRTRHLDKTYLALALGHWPKQINVVNTPLQKYLLPDGERRVRVVTTDHPQAQLAISYVRVLAHLNSGTDPRNTLNAPQGVPLAMGNDLFASKLSLLEVKIKTGRTHQIRVHLASKGHPIIGDSKYGDTSDINEIKEYLKLERMFLHAWQLRLPHPITNESLTLRAPLPEELKSCILKLNPTTIITSSLLSE